MEGPRLLKSLGGAQWAACVVLMMGCSPKPRPWPEVPSSPPDAVGPAAGSESRDPHDWFYTGSAGPSAWGTLRPEWSACADVEKQSPVDLPLEVLTAQPASAPPTGAKKPDTGPEARAEAPFSGVKLDSRLGALPLEVSSDGRVVQLTGAASQTISVDGKLATLKRGELRRPAEHVLGGVTFDFEIVLWFSQEDNSPLALSLLFRQGAENTALASLIAGLPTLPHYGPTMLSGRLPLGELLGAAKEGGKFLSYWGSESVPPCTAPVARLVFAYVGEISREQVDKLRTALPSLMARPVQPLGPRAVGVVELNQPSTAAPASSDTPTAAQKPATPSPKK